MFPQSLQNKLDKRKAEKAFRTLGEPNDLVDFSSNDYLGFSKSQTIFVAVKKILEQKDLKVNGSTGSRLLTGNHSLYQTVENQLAKIHESESATIFNSGYDANVGLFSSVPQRGDVILYDEFIHASIRDGITISKAETFKFKHNDLKDLQIRLEKAQNTENIYVVSESVFSMDGDSPDLLEMVKITSKYDAFLIIDEAHAVGVFGRKGVGLIQSLGLQDKVFARIVTFGKALGAHGAVILGSENLKEYLVNFSRSLIYTTALPPHSLATISAAYDELQNGAERNKLHKNISHFKAELRTLGLSSYFIQSDSAIHSCIIPGNEKVKNVSRKIQEEGFNVKAILYPSVQKGQERLRFGIHSFNPEKEISSVLDLLSKIV